jgi:phenylpropionate dioxygenase-like ring-hydroxylating dioxygenase large terminal subunit
MVAWRDDAGAWRVAHAACPHRLASLADGRLIDGGASLECRYHGWRFGGDGACVHCPQATDGAACAAVRGSRRSRLRTYPAVVEEGVLWVWPQEGADAAAAAAATPLPLWRDDAPEAATVSFVSMRPPVDWMLMTENSVDP